MLERLKRYLEVRRLRAGVRRGPSPRSFGALAERHLAHGELDAALAVAESGLARYPDSERLQQVRSFAKRKALAGRIRRLRAEIARRPTPFAYTSLAEIHRELDDDDEALRLAAACSEAFPLNAQPLLVQAEIRVERFLRDVVARDAILAEAALRRVLDQNANSVKARLLLAELCHLVGATADCRRHLAVVLEERDPGAGQVQAYLDAAPASEDDGAAEPLSAEAFARAARAVEDAGEFAAQPDAFPALVQHGGGTRRERIRRIDVDGLSRDVARVGRSAGMRNTVLLDRDGAVLAEHADDGGMSRDGFAQVVRELRRTADETSRRMDAGALVRAEIAGPAGDLTVVRLQRLTIGALYSEPLRTDRVWELLQDVTSRNVAPHAEVACA